MTPVTFTLNGEQRQVDVEPEMPLLWVLRDVIGLTGTKYSCGVGLCGSCTVHVDGEARRSCTLPVSEVEGRQVITIEGLSPDGDHPLQHAWLSANVPQCGYCQSGQIMAAAALLAETPDPGEEQIDEVMAGVLCRCGTYQRIRAAIHLAAGMGGGS